MIHVLCILCVCVLYVWVVLWLRKIAIIFFSTQKKNTTKKSKQNKIKKQNGYIIATSSSYVDKTTPLYMKYGSGSASGTLAQDSMALGSVSATLEFGVISSASNFGTAKWSGIFALNLTYLLESRSNSAEVV